MNRSSSRPDGRSASAGVKRWLVAALLASVLAAGCDRPFEPFGENQHGPFSMVGYLDMKADTQSVRVMPVRQSLLSAPEPIDAVVTLEHLGSSRTVALKDSLFTFTDSRLGGVAYAHNFWTTERLEAKARYRLKAVRSDGASTTAVVDMPDDLEISFLNDRRVGSDIALLQVRAERVLSVDVFYGMGTRSGEPAQSISIGEHWTFSTGVPGTQGIGIRGKRLALSDLVDVGRREIRLVVGRSDWPYDPGLPDVAVSVPGTIPSDVETGLGFVGGVAIWTIPFHHCELVAPRAGAEEYCTIKFNAQSASISGSVIRGPCGDPHVIADVRLREKFADGGAVIRTCKTGWDGSYRFEGIEPGADLVLELSSGTPAVHLPRLAPGERYAVKDIVVPGC